MSINNLTLAPSIVLDTDGSKIGVIVDGARYTGYDLAEVQEFMQDTITRYDGLIATERAKKKPNLVGIASLEKQIALLKQAISLLNPNGPADQAIKADEAAELAARKAREAAAPPPPPPPPPAPPPAPPPPPSPTANAAVVTSNAAPTTSTGTATKAPLTGAASDDSGAKQENPAGSTGAPPSTPPGSATGTAPNTTGTGAQASADSTAPSLRTEVSKTQPPGKRLKNPLGYCSSYTYQLSLYMITPDGYDAFIQSGRKTVNALNVAAAGTGKAGGGAFLVAQSGGINNTQEDRAPGFAFDYSIDNLSFRTSTNGKDNKSSTNTTEIKFNITEPYGFSFVNNLKKAQDALKSYSGDKVLLPGNPSKQFYILGVRFFGYDEAGNIMTGSEVFDGQTLDPNASGSGALFERYYDIVITSLKFKIDGNAVVYSIEAASTPPKATMTTKRGSVDDKVVFTASTVGEAFTKFTESLNKRQQDLASKTNEPNLYNKYSIKLIGDAETVIGKAKTVSPADLDKFKWPGSGATKTSQSNELTATKNNTPNNTTREITIDTGKMIPTAINDIITSSQFLEQGLQTVYSTALEPPKDKKSVPQVDQGTKKLLKWYNCSSQISNARWNGSISDWVYDIDYIIQTYETPVIDSAYKNVTTEYYGPHKRYDYWYTGKNSEILSYVQELNNSYFTVAISPPNEQGDVTLTDSAAKENADASTETTDSGKPAVKAGGNQTEGTTENKLGAGKEAQNSYITSLFDPTSQASAKLTILGDPDFICYDSGYSENQLYNKFYGADGYTVNPNGGQVFIEVDFKEAVDYGSEGIDNGPITGQPGTLSINESILFWEYPEDIAKLVKGVSYMVIAVTSTFSGGSFKQTMECAINTFNKKPKTDSKGGREPNSSQTGQAAGTSPASGTNVASGSAAGGSNTTVADSGLKPDSPAKLPVVTVTDPGPLVTSANADALIAEILATTPTGLVVDDDASSSVAAAPLSKQADINAAQQREPAPSFSLNINAPIGLPGRFNPGFGPPPFDPFPPDFPLT
jgi:hypothetical protein